MKTLLAVLILSTTSGCTALLAVNSKMECLQFPDKVGPPSVAEGKFPFKLTYENRGVRGIIEDARICKLEERVCTGGYWENHWKDSYASGKHRLVIPPGTDGRSYVIIPHGACYQLMSGDKPPHTSTVYLLEGTKVSPILEKLGGVKPEVHLQYEAGP